ncbi:MAG TPA: MBL fold metallo-hydrolase [Pyrinomonadaceae bacterium]|jgi:glyoxylase-like metal-dependent hydrolase (beta-lactamase superfamily II)/8-oxo-dGTP pyrophosphatase MutT (NUDIX family)|nr:MBL fold metallo-hydrolase [Pyrinomonadaceae bacterium]
MSERPLTTPKDAAAIILLRQDTDPANPEVFWVKRSDKLAFLGGFHAFPGGQIDAADAEVEVKNSPNPETSAMISGAARELFEELGVLAVRGGETLTKGQRTSLLDDLESGRISWPALLKHYELYLDADDFTYVGRWVTPPFNARRFDTWFFLVNCPSKQEPNVIAGELSSGEWLTARKAYERWMGDQVVAVPPTLHALRTLAAGISPDLVERFLSIEQAYGVPERRITFRPNYICFPVRTPTRPPATHTCCYIVHNSKEMLIFDPGSPYEDEQQVLADCVDEMISEGRQVREIILTHLHPDHVGGVNALKSHLGGAVPVGAHAQTAAALNDIQVDHLIEDNEVIALEGEPTIRLRALHTPGHALGHLCFHDDARGVLMTGDNIVGVGSVLIDPPQGNMRDYLQSLERMRSLPNLSILLGGHGPAVATPYQKIDEYISHRLEREQNILAAVRAGATTPKEIVEHVYTDVSPKAHAMAERAVLAHLEKLEADGLI